MFAIFPSFQILGPAGSVSGTIGGVGRPDRGPHRVRASSERRPHNIRYGTTQLKLLNEVGFVPIARAFPSSILDVCLGAVVARRDLLAPVA